MPGADKRSAVQEWLAQNRSASRVHEAFGAEWDVPAQPPAKLWFWARATFIDAGRNIFTEARYSDLDEAIEILDLAPLIVEWAEYGVSMSDVYNQVHAIVLRYLYPGLFEDGDGQGEAKPPSRARTSASSSRSTSGSSRRTGGASTKRTSTRKSKGA